MGSSKMLTGWRFGSAPFELMVNEEHPHRSVLWRAEKQLDLTDLDTKLLVLVVTNAGKVVSKEQQIKEAWDGVPVGDGAMATALFRLREKIGEPIIKTEYNAGLRLDGWFEPMGNTEELRARYIIALFTDADPERQIIPDAAWDQKYAPEIGGVRTSLTWAMAERGRRFFAINLLGTTAPLYERLSLLPEARANADRILPLIDKDIPAAAAVRFFTYAGSLWRDANRLKALSLFERAFAFRDQLKDSDILATLLGKSGGTRFYLGQLDEAESDLEEAIKKLSKTDRKKDLANAYNDLGSLFVIRNYPSGAKDCFDRAIATADSYNDLIRKYLVVANLGAMEFNEGAPDRALLRYKEADRGLESAPNAYRLPISVNLAMCYATQGDVRKARFQALKALALCTDGDGRWRWLAWLVLAFLAAHYGEHAYAAQLLGAIKQLFAGSGDAWQKLSQLLHDLLMKMLQENLSADSLGVWLIEGGRWNETQAAAFVESHILPAIPAETADIDAK